MGRSCWSTFGPPGAARAGRSCPTSAAAYQEYHNRGFDVVGVSIDDETDKLEHFLAEESLPWVTLHDLDKAKDGGHPLAEYYGIMGIPTVILVGKDGNVVSLAARGDELWEQLAKLSARPPRTRPLLTSRRRRLALGQRRQNRPRRSNRPSPWAPSPRAPRSKRPPAHVWIALRSQAVRFDIGRVVDHVQRLVTPARWDTPARSTLWRPECSSSAWDRPLG